ncbi:MAG: hypothetical protein ACQETM_05050, partial [Bacteroidota bacterium]
GWMFGWTDNYIRVMLPHDADLIAGIVLCRLLKLNPSGAVRAIRAAEPEIFGPDRSLSVLTE